MNNKPLPGDFERAPRPQSAPAGKTLEVLNDPHWRARFFAEIGNGSPPYLAAELTGIPRDTMYSWIRKGGGRQKGGVPDDAPEPYRTFVIQLRMAEATSQRPIVSNMYEYAKKDANFGMRFLQARDPGEWSPDRFDPADPMLGDADIEYSERQVVIRMSKEDYREWLAGQATEAIEAGNAESATDYD